ncbi:MAG TPA: IPT/TIG domain-containing protein, partial [Capillimicrobium sp.]
MNSRLAPALIALTAALATAAPAAGQALPTSAVIGSPAVAPGPTTTLGCGPCLLTQETAGAGEVIASPFAGTLTQWTVTTSGSGQVSLVTLRVPPNGQPGVYLPFDRTAPQPVGPDTQTSQFAASIPVQPGDLISVEATGAVGVLATTSTGGRISTGSVLAADSATFDGTQPGTLALGATVMRTPAVSGVTPSTGPLAGGAPVTITGQNLDTVTDVRFGGTPATSFVINASDSITAISPAGAAAGDVEVTVSGTTGPGSASGRFGYLLPLTPPPPGAERCEVPDVVGRTLAAARRALRRADCALGEVTRAQ